MTNVVYSLANMAQCTRLSYSSASAKRIEMERTLFDFLVAVVSHRGEREREVKIREVVSAWREQTEGNWKN